MGKNKHWTSESLADFGFFVASDFVTQIQSKLSSEDLSQADLAERVGVTEGRISQIFNTPGNMTLNTMIQYARSLDLKLTVMVYDDGDRDFQRGPVLSDVFHSCWTSLGKPLDNWEFEEKAQTHLISAPWSSNSSSQHYREHGYRILEACAPLNCKKGEELSKVGEPPAPAGYAEEKTELMAA